MTRRACLSLVVIPLLALGWGGKSATAVPTEHVQATTLDFNAEVGDRAPGWTLKKSGPEAMILTWTSPTLMLNQIRVAQQNWHDLTWASAAVRGEPGEPGLPVVSRLVAVPDGMSLAVESVTATPRTIPNLRLIPVQDPASEGFSYLPEAYAKRATGTAIAPEVQVGPPAVMAGRTVVPVSFSPVHYDAATRQGTVWPLVEVSLALVPAKDGQGMPRRADRVLPRSFARGLGGHVLGAESGLESRAKAGGGEPGFGTYAAVHAGVNGVAAGIAPLLKWRREQGYHVVELDISQIGGTTGSIKTALQSLYDDTALPPLEIVTIFGDVGGDFSVPAWTESLSGYAGGGDHYYSLLDGNDILADVHLGRVSFRTAAEMNTIVAKIIGYEKTPPMADTGWYRRALLQGDPSASGITTIYTNQWLKGQLLGLGWTEVDTTWSGDFVSPVISKVGQGASVYGYRGYFGTSGINNGHVSILNNGGQLVMALLPTCDSGSFASMATARSEAWLRAPNGGAVAAIGTATIGTHTRYNNCYYLGAWDQLLNGDDHRIGVAHTRGKLDLYTGYYLAEPDRAEIWAVWNNVMGDAATPLWTGVPRDLDVSYAGQISLGAQAMMFAVAHGGQPVAGADVSLYSEAEDFQLSGVTDAAGEVMLNLPSLGAGSVTVTVTGHNYLPHQSGFAVGPVDVFCAASGHTIVAGGDGLLNPGETADLTPLLTNHGTSDAFGISADVTVRRGPATITAGNIAFPTIPSGGEVAANSAVSLTVRSDAADGETVSLLLTVTDGTEVWTSLREETVRAAAFEIADMDLADFGGSLDPGEFGRFDLTLVNQGSIDATAVSATVSFTSPWVAVTNATANFGDMTVSGAGRDPVAPFALSVSPDCFGGHLAPFDLAITYSNGLQAVVHGAVTIGSAASDQPTGPDTYGYYAFDDTDTGSELAPTYDWVAIDPDHGGLGTDLGLTDFGWEQDETKTIDLPFAFGFYGKQYTKASICSNGWLAMGTTPINFYRNFPLPAAHSPGAIIAPFWDNLNQTGNKKVYTWYDAAEHRFIVQWYEMPNHFSGSPQNFQVILLDPAFHPTGTGDGLILFQYAEVHNTDTRDGYATVGLQNMARTMGSTYTYWNQYAPGAAPLTSGRAILWAPSYEVALPQASVSPGAMDLTLQPGGQALSLLHIANNGEPGSMLSFALNKRDPLTQVGIKSLGGEGDPEAVPASLEGSTLTTPVTSYEHGTSLVLPLHLTCSSPDNEWLSRLDLDLPPGVTVVSATDFPANSGVIRWNGESGDGVSTTWGDQGSGLPYLDHNQSADASVTLSFASGLIGDVAIDWAVFGDNWGNPPHTATGQLVLTAIGPVIGVSAPSDAAVAVLGDTLQVAFVAANGPTLVNIDLQREVAGAWQRVASDVPAGAATWPWPVSGAPGPYARFRVSDAGDATVLGLSGAFVVSRDLSWLQLASSTGQVAAGQAQDVTVTVDATGLANGLYEAQLVVLTNGGAPAIVPVALIVGAVSAVGELPAATALLGNHPNPFNPVTMIDFALDSAQEVTLRVYSPRGRLVRVLLAGALPAGPHGVVWDGRDDGGRSVASGVYFYRLESTAAAFTGKMVLAK